MVTSELAQLVETLLRIISVSWMLGGETVEFCGGAWDILYGGEMVVGAFLRAADMVLWVCGVRIAAGTALCDVE